MAHWLSCSHSAKFGMYVEISDTTHSSKVYYSHNEEFWESRVTPTQIQNGLRDFPGGAVVKNPPANAGDTGLVPGPGRSHVPRSN